MEIKIKAGWTEQHEPACIFGEGASCANVLVIGAELGVNHKFAIEHQAAVVHRYTYDERITKNIYINQTNKPLVPYGWKIYLVGETFTSPSKNMVISISNEIFRGTL